MEILLMSLFPRWALRRLERRVGLTPDRSKTPATRLDAIALALDIKYVEVCTQLEKFVSALDPHGNHSERVEQLCTSRVGPNTLANMYALLIRLDDFNLPEWMVEDYKFEDHCDLLEDVGLLRRSVFQLVRLRGMLVPPQVYDAWPVP